MMNACYDPGYNNITITSAITNEPFFSTKSDYYTNLGGLGAVIAHEMGHAFDSNCIVFNSKGEYDPSWIPEKDLNFPGGTNPMSSETHLIRASVPRCSFVRGSYLGW